ncbi:hypothetical protein CSC34_6709 [Pseudomonas aeruginosa]|nr:hypothetical protein CSC34_6709 [Pseudomonas aeruginosa]
MTRCIALDESTQSRGRLVLTGLETASVSPVARDWRGSP